MGTCKSKGPLLARIFGDKEIKIEEILYHETGHESLLNEALFVHIDPNTEEWRHSLKSATAKEVYLEVYKVLRNATTVSALFDALGRDLKDLCIEQSQIAKFVRVYGRTKLMHDCRSTLFLTEVDHEPCVVEVRSYPGVDQRVPHIFSAGVHHIWKFLGGPTHRLQIVVPSSENL